MKHEISTHFSETQVGPNQQDLKTVSDSVRPAVARYIW